LMRRLPPTSLHSNVRPRKSTAKLQCHHRHRPSAGRHVLFVSFSLSQTSAAAKTRHFRQPCSTRFSRGSRSNIRVSSFTVAFGMMLDQQQRADVHQSTQASGVDCWRLAWTCPSRRATYDADNGGPATTVDIAPLQMMKPHE